ncbi:MAG: GNAT family N-acetyltransferase [Pseudomonadota bacterium]
MFSVGFVKPDQHESLVVLLCELFSYYNKPADVSPEVVEAHLHNRLLAEDSPLRMVVAAGCHGDVVGMAAISLTYSVVIPTPDGFKQCQLKELYVREGQRRRGAGYALMKWVAHFACDQGCCRIDWPVKSDNDKGISFYQRLGALRVPNRASYRLSGAKLRALGAER